MKGHIQDGKFHPHKPYQKGVRKSRDQSVKQQGIRLKRKNTPRIPFSVLDKTEDQLYALRDQLSDQMEQETWLEVNSLIDKIQNYKLKFYDGTGKSFNPERKSRVPSNFKTSNPEFADLITTGARYDSLSEEDRQAIIRHFGLGTQDSIIRTQSIPYSMLNNANKILLQEYLGGIQDADVGAVGYNPTVLRNHLGFNNTVQRLKSGDTSNLLGDIMDIERIIKENIGWTYRGTSETPEVNKAFLESLESLGLPSSIITERLLRELDEGNSGSLSIALGVIYNKQIHQPETVHARGLDV